MGYRILFLSNPMKLNIKNEQLVIDNGEITKVPLEDIECIAVDGMQISLNAYLFTKLSEYAITLYFTDKTHHPCGVYLPLSRHSRHLSVLKNQINMTEHMRKVLWKQIVIQKIENQANVLKLCGCEQWQSIDCIKKKVKHGDSENMEAVAASQYFKLLFGKGFARSADNEINSCLNYGYAVLRSTIAKYLVAYGYEPALGLFHKSLLNNFNLADDIIEPFRPMVDLFVKTHLNDNLELTTSTKAQLVNLLSMNMLFDGKRYTCARTIENTVQSLSSVLNERSELLVLPKILELKQHQYE